MAGRPDIRAARRAAGQCIDCGERSETQRCRACRERVEANTARYHGQGRPGRIPAIVTDLKDLRYAADALGKAFAGFTEVAGLGPIQPRRRDDLLEEPLAQVHLCWKFLREVLDRSGRYPMPGKAKRCAPARSASAPKPKLKRQDQLMFAGPGWTTR